MSLSAEPGGSKLGHQRSGYNPKSETGVNISYKCNLPNIKSNLPDFVREIQLRINPDPATRCAVWYTKRTEEPESVGQSLWRANNDRQYCERKLNAFRQKLEKSGWTCLSTNS